MKIGSLFTGIGGLELGVCDTVISIVPYGNDIEWMMGFPKGWVTDADDVSRTAQHSWRPSETRAHPDRLPKPFTTGSCN